MGSTDLVLAIYPLHQSYQCLKRPRLASLQHWLIFWQIWVGLHLLDGLVEQTKPIYQWIPFTGIVLSFYNVMRFLAIVTNYSPQVTYTTHRIFLKFTYNETVRLSRRIRPLIDHYVPIIREYFSI